MKFNFLNEKTGEIYRIFGDTNQLDKFFKKVLSSDKVSNMVKIIDKIFTFADDLDSREAFETIETIKDGVTGLPTDITVFLSSDLKYNIGELQSDIKAFVRNEYHPSWGIEVSDVSSRSFKVFCDDWNLRILVMNN